MAAYLRPSTILSIVRPRIDALTNAAKATVINEIVVIIIFLSLFLSYPVYVILWGSLAAPSLSFAGAKLVPFRHLSQLKTIFVAFSPLLLIQVKAFDPYQP